MKRVAENSRDVEQIACPGGGTQTKFFTFDFTEDRQGTDLPFCEKPCNIPSVTEMPYAEALSAREA